VAAFGHADVDVINDCKPDKRTPDARRLSDSTAQVLKNMTDMSFSYVEQFECDLRQCMGLHIKT